MRNDHNEVIKRIHARKSKQEIRIVIKQVEFAQDYLDFSNTEKITNLAINSNELEHPNNVKKEEKNKDIFA